MTFDIDRFDKQISKLFSLLFSKKEHKSPAEIDESSVRTIFEIIRKNFEYKDVDYTKANHVLVVRKFLKKILIISSSVIMKLNHEILINFLCIVKHIFENGDSFLTSEEFSDYVFRIANSRTPLLEMEIPFSNKMRAKIKERGRQFCEGHAHSSMSLLLLKIVESRKLVTKISDHQMYDCLIFFTKLFVDRFPMDFLDNDIAKLMRHMWPPRISEVIGAESFCREAAADAIGNRFLPKKCAVELSRNSRTITLKWTDGLKEELDRSRYKNATFDVLTRVSALDGLVKLLLTAVKDQGAIGDAEENNTRWLLLVSVIKSHKIEMGSGLSFFNEDIVDLLNLCFETSHDLATKLYHELLVDADDTYVSVDCVKGLKHWPVPVIVCNNLLTAMKTWTKHDVRILLSYLASPDRILQDREFLDLFWNTVSEILLSDKTIDMELFDFLLSDIREIVEISCDCNNGTFFSLVNLLSFQMNEECSVEENLKSRVIKWLLTVAHSMSKKNNDRKNLILFIRNVLSRIEWINVEDVPFNVICAILASSQNPDVSDLVDASLLLMASLLKQETNCVVEEILPETKTRTSIVNSLIEICTSRRHGPIVCRSSFWVLMRILIMSKTPVSVSILESHATLCGVLCEEIFCQEMNDTRLLEGVIRLCVQPTLIQVGLVVMQRLFHKLFDTEVTDEDKYLGHMFNQFSFYAEYKAIHDFLRHQNMNLMIGFSHKLHYIRDSCIKLVGLVHGLDQQEQTRLLRVVQGHGRIELDSSQSLSIAASELVEEKETKPDVLTMYSQRLIEKTNVNITNETFDEEISKIHALSNGKSTKYHIQPDFLVCDSNDISELPQELQDDVPPTSMEPLIETETMKSNLKLIMDSAENPMNLLLEGSTGIGKTAIVLEAARRLKKPVIRCNMCANTTMANVFGTAVPLQDGDKISVTFKEGPFTRAFRAGAWLLLDEMNLAPEMVLSCIENALDLGVLFLPTESASDGQGSEEGKRFVEYSRHPNFRLFCTQNPNTGHYRGRRETQSAAMLSRYIPVTLRDPSLDEMKQIIRCRLERRGLPLKIAATTARLITQTHEEIQKSLKDPNFDEGCASYAEITLRDAIRWADRVQSRLADAEKMTSVEGSMLARFAWGIYGTRFRKDKNRKKIREAIQTHLACDDSDVEKTSLCVRFLDTYEGEAQIDDMTTSFYLPQTDKTDPILKLCHQVYAGLVNALFSESYEFVPSFGPEFFQSVLDLIDNESFDLSVKKIYIAFLNLSRDSQMRKKISDVFLNCYSKLFESDGSFLLQVGTSLSSSLPSVFVNEETKKCWGLIMRALNHCQPVLLTGDSGCGKSETIRALARTVHQKVVHLHISPQTEPEILVGSFVPTQKGIEWQDGLVTRAVKEGHWLVLENLSEAPSTVLERLNSVLETPATWTVCENSKETPHSLKIHDDFRILATMTPPSTSRLSGANMTTNSELSPALYNRFAIVHMTDALSEIENARQLFAAAAGDSPLMEHQEAFVRLVDMIDSQEKNVSTRHFIRTIDGAYKVYNSEQEIDSLEALKIVMILSLDHSVAKSTSLMSTSNILADFSSHRVGLEKLYDGMKKNSNHQHVIDQEQTPSHYKNACLLTTAILCNYPSLLEGPAATGKTSLVAHLADGFRRTLERVNNTENTSVTDYLGSLLPDGSFAPGPLVRAMKEGSFFLADEFDLAEPAILNMLYPLLEGHGYIMVPGINEMMTAHENFRFFATQNGASYVGRKELPATLRSRFTEVDFLEFTKQELCFIIKNRRFPEYDSSPGLEDEVQQKASCLAAAYASINLEAATFFGKGIKLTMREVTKWIRRKSAFPDSSWCLLGFQLLYTRASPKTHVSLARIITESFSDFDEMQNSKTLQSKIVVDKTQHQLFNVSHPEQKLEPFANRDAALWNMLGLSSPSFLEHLWNMCLATKCHEPVLLVGPTSCKSHLIDTWCRLNQRNDTIYVLCNRDSDSADLVGRLRPYSLMEAASFLLQMATQFVFLSNNEMNLLFHVNNEEFLSASQFLKNELDESLNELTMVINNAIQQVILKNDVKKILCGTKQTMLSQIREDVDNAADDDSDILPRIVDTINRDSVFDSDESYCSSESSNENPLNDSDTESEPENPLVDSDSCASSIDHNAYREHSDPSGNSFDADTDDDENRSILGNAPSSVSTSGDSFLDLNFAEETETWKNLFKSTAFTDMINNMKKFESLFERITPGQDMVNYNSLSVILQKFNSTLCKVIENCNNDSESQIIFLFQDGPCTLAVKEGRTLILEDIDQPSQAVTERVNSLLETEPFFSVFEDLTIGNYETLDEMDERSCTSRSNAQTCLRVSPKMHIFATTNASSREKMSLSPAIRSRMSEIMISEYDDDDLINISH